MRRRRRRAFFLSQSARDALVLLALGIVGVIGLLWWSEYALAVLAISLALIILFVIHRSTSR
jgi:hypothetical protein